MPSTRLTTTSLLLTEDQSRLLKKVAASRMMRGDMPTASVSEVIRKMIEQHEAAFLAELEGTK